MLPATSMPSCRSCPAAAPRPGQPLARSHPFRSQDPRRGPPDRPLKTDWRVPLVRFFPNKPLTSAFTLVKGSRSGRECAELVCMGDDGPQSKADLAREIATLREKNSELREKMSVLKMKGTWGIRPGRMGQEVP